MRDTSAYSDQDILYAVRTLQASGFGSLIITIQDSRVVTCDVIFKTRTSAELHQISTGRYRATSLTRVRESA